MKGALGVNIKSALINNGLAFLLIARLLNHFIGNVPRNDCEIASGSKMFTPELFLQVRVPR